MADTACIEPPARLTKAVGLTGEDQSSGRVRREICGWSGAAVADSVTQQLHLSSHCVGELFPMARKVDLPCHKLTDISMQEE